MNPDEGRYLLRLVRRGVHVVPDPDQRVLGRSDRGAVRAANRHPDVLAGQRRERARVRSEKGIRWGGHPLANTA